LIDISNLLHLRLVTSFLGEKSQFNWWQSDFFSPTAESFLNPLFPKTQFLGQAEGASAAARKGHDERIGVGRVFHLFRLPEDFEQAFHQRLQDATVIEDLKNRISTRETAFEFLESKFGKPESNEIGPQLVGDISQITETPVVQAIARAYLSGFKNEETVLPYLKDEQE